MPRYQFIASIVNHFLILIIAYQHSIQRHFVPTVFCLALLSFTLRQAITCDKPSGSCLLLF